VTQPTTDDPPPGCRPITNTDGQCEPIPGYAASPDGVILRHSKTGRWFPLKPTPKGRGGLLVCRIILADGRKREISLARLICRAFHGPRPLGDDVFWFPDEDRHNCRASNLRWAPKGSVRLGKAPKVRGRVTHKGEQNPGAQLTDPDVRQMRRWYREGHTARAIAEHYGHSETSTRRAICGKTWAHITGPDGPVPMRRTGAPAGNSNRTGKLLNSTQLYTK
jgi:hypothetical protein